MRKKSWIAFLIAGCLGGCAGGGTTSVVTIQDLNHYRVDCTRKPEQLAFLNTQLDAVGRDHNSNAMLLRSSIGHVTTVGDGTFNDRRYRARGYHEALIRSYINWIEDHC